MINDIINLRCPPNMKHRMSLYERSAQFSSFDALEGFSDAVGESERITSKKITLDEDKREILNRKLSVLLNNKVEATFIYFEKDNKKSGGSYKRITGIIKKIDFINKQIILFNGKINMEFLVDIEL